MPFGQIANSGMSHALTGSQVTTRAVIEEPVSMVRPSCLAAVMLLEKSRFVAASHRAWALFFGH
jgi:hypothetical protein